MDWSEVMQKIENTELRLSDLNEWVEKNQEDLKTKNGVRAAADKMYRIVESATKLERRLKSL